MTHDERRAAYARGELSLDDARAFEAELERAAGPTEEAIAMPGTSETDAAEIGAALRALDAIEARRRGAVAFTPPRSGSPGALVVIGALLAIAAVVMLALWAWPSGDRPRIADRDTDDAEVLEPLKVAPPTQVAGPGIDSEAAGDVAVAGAQDAGPTEDGERLPERTGVAFVPRNNRAITIDVATTSLGRGAEWRAEHPNAARPERIAIAPSPTLENAATSGLVHWVVLCLDDQGTSARRLDVRQRAGGGKSAPRLEVTTRDDELARCLRGYPYAGGRVQLAMRFERGQVAPGEK